MGLSFFSGGVVTTAGRDDDGAIVSSSKGAMPRIFLKMSRGGRSVASVWDSQPVVRKPRLAPPNGSWFRCGLP